MTIEPELISERDFEEQYRPRTAESGDLFTYAQVKDAPLHTVWSIVEGDEEDASADDDEPATASWFALPGYHVVNVLGYILTEGEWTDETQQALYFDAS